MNTIFYNGRICGGSGWEKPTWHELIVVDDDKILYVGSQDGFSDNQEEIFGNPENPIDLQLIDLNGSYVFPGFGDAHLHLAAGGEFLSMVNLEDMNKDEVRKALTEAVQERKSADNGIVRALNWESRNFHLDANVLEEWLPGAELIISRRDLHSCLVSKSILKRASIDKDTPDPEGGHIEHDRNGELTGYLYEAAGHRVFDLLPQATEAMKRDYILKGQDHLLKLGITAVSEVLNTGDEVIYKALDDAGDLKLQVDAWMRYDNWDGETPPPENGKRFQLKTLKLFLDGAYGSDTAAMLEPYSHDAGKSGILILEDDDLREKILKAQNAGWKCAVHAIGDRAVDQICRILNSIPEPDFGNHRIEHCQTLPDNYIDSIARCGAIASVQPIHLIDDQRWVSDKIGEQRCRNSFVWKSLLDRGVTVAIGSDWPVANPDPLLNIHAAINRCDFDGKPHPHFNINEALQPHQAVRSATYGWAKACEMDGFRGALVPGQSSDLTIVAEIDDEMRDWSKAKIEAVVCKGESLI